MRLKDARNKCYVWQIEKCGRICDNNDDVMSFKHN